jgi:ubiquinone/menaquinone biosynthesis C-methylase UbiE
MSEDRDGSPLPDLQRPQYGVDAPAFLAAAGMAAETQQERSRRHQQRILFDGAALLYDATRPGYPEEIVELLVTTAKAGAGSTVLEVGCGTGQLTQSLAGYGFSLMAIDIGPSMIAAAQQRLAGSAVLFQATSFEDFKAADSSFDLIVSGTAFHWVDPEVKFAKSARLLRPGGWLALLATGERYDDPFGAALVDMWAARSEDGGAWARRRQLADTEIIAGTGLFGQAIEQRHQERLTLPADAVIGLENTRAVSLSWTDEARQEFTAELRQHLKPAAAVSLTRQTVLTMARTEPRSATSRQGRTLAIPEPQLDWPA